MLRPQIPADVAIGETHDDSARHARRQVSDRAGRRVRTNDGCDSRASSALGTPARGSLGALDAAVTLMTAGTRTLTYGDAERTAWGIVLAALERAIDVDGLQPVDRGALAELHDRAGWHIGTPRLTLADIRAATAHADGPAREGDLRELARYGVDSVTLAVLIYTARLRHIAELERRSDADLLRIHRIGPARLRAIRAAIARHREQPGGSAP